MIAHHDTPSVPTDGRPACSLLAIGDGKDRKAFIDTIRALALVKRYGDRLTLVGYGRHRRSLEKWAVALQVDHLVVFGAPCGNHQPVEDEDVVIRVGPATLAVTVRDGPARHVARGDRIALADILLAPGLAPRSYADAPSQRGAHRPDAATIAATV